MDLDELRSRVEEIRWWHRIDLGNGIVTPGIDDTPDKLRRARIPDDLSGWSVIDVGAWDGFFSFECERRGADRVLAVDSFSWGGPGWGTKDGFDLVHQVLDSKVESKECDLFELDPEVDGTFDLVLFLGVIYHLRHPLLALEKMRSLTSRMMVLESVIEMADHRRPVVSFYPNDELKSDGSNWWGPNLPALVGMVESSGFSRVEVVDYFVEPRSRLKRVARRIYNAATKKDHALCDSQSWGRAILHAYP